MNDSIINFLDTAPQVKPTQRLGSGEFDSLKLAALAAQCKVEDKVLVSLSVGGDRRICWGVYERTRYEVRDALVDAFGGEVLFGHDPNHLKVVSQAQRNVDGPRDY